MAATLAGRSRALGVLLLPIGLVFCLLARPAEGDKMKAEEILAKHLESIGTAEARASIRNCTVKGSVMVSLHSGGGGQVSGQALLASEDTRNLIVLEFSSPDYPFEKIGFDGRKLTVRPLRPGFRSPLGQFFLSHESMFSEGLMGGTLSASWPLLAPDLRKAKLEYRGTKKIGERKTYELKYQPRHRADTSVNIYFDSENFQHLRTKYEHVIAAQMGEAPGTSISRRETRYIVVEDFSDFRKEGPITLPHNYKMELAIQSQSGNLVIDWQMVLDQFSFNQAMGTEEFVVDQ